MTFEAQETSDRDGDKIFLYTWTYGPQSMRYTSAVDDITIASATWTAAQVDHEQIENSGKIERIALDVTVPADHPVALLYRENSPSSEIRIAIAEYHVNDVDHQIEVFWTGLLTDASWDMKRGICKMTHEPTYARMQRNGMRRRAQRMCPYVLYGPDCLAPAATYRQIAEATAVVGTQVSTDGLGGKADGYFNGGYIEYTLPGGQVERRTIAAHTGSTLVLREPPHGLSATMSINAYPGCDHTTGANGCAKFNNLEHFGGFNNFPSLNPFGGKTVY